MRIYLLYIFIYYLQLIIQYPRNGMGQYRLLSNEWVNTDCGEFIVDYTIAEKSSMKIYLKHWEDEEFGSKFEL